MGSGKMLRAGSKPTIRVEEHIPTHSSGDQPSNAGRVSPAPLVACLSHAAAALAIILLAGCADKPVVVAVDTLCVSTSRPQITEAQRAAFKADQGLWEPLVDWLAGFLKVRDGACLRPTAGP